MSTKLRADKYRKSHILEGGGGVGYNQTKKNMTFSTNYATTPLAQNVSEFFEFPGCLPSLVRVRSNNIRDSDIASLSSETNFDRYTIAFIDHVAFLNLRQRNGKRTTICFVF